MAKEITDIDRELGARLRDLRKARKLSQTSLGEALGVTFQQVQKMEKGTNRTSVAALITICKKLRVTPDDLIGHHFADATSDVVKLVSENAALRAQLAKVKGALA